MNRNVIDFDKYRKARDNMARKAAAKTQKGKAPPRTTNVKRYTYQNKGDMIPLNKRRRRISEIIKRPDLKPAEIVFLERYSDLSDELDRINQRIQEAVDSAREEGVTWTFIGKATGVSRQAVQKKYTPEGQASQRKANEAHRSRYDYVKVAKGATAVAAYEQQGS